MMTQNDKKGPLFALEVFRHRCVSNTQGTRGYRQKAVSVYFTSDILEGKLSLALQRSVDTDTIFKHN